MTIRWATLFLSCGILWQHISIKRHFNLLHIACITVESELLDWGQGSVFPITYHTQCMLCYVMLLCFTFILNISAWKNANWVVKNPKRNISTVSFTYKWKWFQRDEHKLFLLSEAYFCFDISRFLSKEKRLRKGRLLLLTFEKILCNSSI